MSHVHSGVMKLVMSMVMLRIHLVVEEVFRKRIVTIVASKLRFVWFLRELTSVKFRVQKRRKERHLGAIVVSDGGYIDINITVITAFTSGSLRTG